MQPGSDNIELVIFDLDGTLVDAYPAIEESFNFAMKKMKLPGQRSMVIRRAVGWGDKNLLLPFTGPRLLTKALYFYRKSHKRTLRHKTSFLPGAHGLLQSLQKQGYKLAIASNRPSHYSHIILDCLKIRNYFDYVLCGDQVKKGKPDPEILRRILKKLSVAPSHALYVGDMTIDVQAGKRAKVKTVAVATGGNNRKELERLKPYKVVGRINDLKKIILNGNGHPKSKGVRA